MRARPERDDFVRARVTWDEAGPQLDPILGQESHMIVQTAAADALVHVPRGEEAAAGGQQDPLPLARSSARELTNGLCTRTSVHGTGAYRPEASAPSCVATAAQAIRTSTVVHGMNPSVISETT